MRIKSYRDLEAWQIGMEFVVSMYSVTRTFPRQEMFGLTAQLRRAAVAIPSNVSEGHQHGTKAYLHFVVIALGSLAEAQTQLELASRLRIGAENELESVSALAVRLRQVLHGLRRSLAARLKDESGTEPEPDDGSGSRLPEPGSRLDSARGGGVYVSPLWEKRFA